MFVTLNNSLIICFKYIYVDTLVEDTNTGKRMLLHVGNRKVAEAEDVSANKRTVFNQIYNKHYG